MNIIMVKRDSGMITVCLKNSTSLGRKLLLREVCHKRFSQATVPLKQ
jgi:hypothetical protein